jgi:CBS domain containing-hemolysin-like protein
MPFVPLWGLHYDFHLTMDETVSYSTGSIIFKLLSVFVLVAANGFFVAAEFALVGVRPSRIETLVAAGSRSAKRLTGLLQNLNAYLSACQLGITLASLGLGWIGEPAIARLLEVPFSGLSDPLRHGFAFAIAFVIITALHIVLGEQAPKLMGLAAAEKVALAVSLPLQLFYRILSWPIRALDWASVRAVQLLGIKATAEHASTYTEEELRRLVDISRESGHLRAEERRLIHSVFDFSDTVVREAMVPRTEMAAIPYTSDLKAITKAFDQYRYSRLPVYKERFDDVCGFIHSKDVMPYLLHPETFKLEDVLQPPLWVVDTARLEHVLRQMQKAKMHFGFVIDEHGGLEGIITLEDLLEEIVGEISDEHDEEVNEQITEIDKSTYVLDGGLAVRDLNRRLKLSLPESEGYMTIGGFLMTEAGHVLKPGEVVQYDGLVFRVERVEKRRVRRVKLEIVQTAGKEELKDELDRARSSA